MAQLPAESVDQFITRLCERAEYCEFGNAKDKNIRDQVVEKCGGLTLEQLQKIYGS